MDSIRKHIFYASFSRINDSCYCVNANRELVRV